MNSPINSTPQPNPPPSELSITTIILGSFVVLLIIIILVLICKKKETNSTLPIDIQIYLQKHKDVLTFRFDLDKIENSSHPKEIKTKKSINDEYMYKHNSLSWSTFHYIYNNIVTNWKLNINDVGMKKYIPTNTIYIYNSFRNKEEIFNKKVYKITKLVTSSENQDIIILCLEEKDGYFKEKYMMILNKNNMNHLYCLSNLPELHTFQNFSYKTYLDVDDHPIHQKIKEIDHHQQEYNQINISDVESGNCDLRRVATLTKQYKEAIEYMKELDVIKKGLESSVNKLNH